MMNGHDGHMQKSESDRTREEFVICSMLSKERVIKWSSNSSATSNERKRKK